MQNRIKLIISILVIAFTSKAYANPSAEVISKDTSFCVSGSSTFVVKFQGTSPFGLIYTVLDENNSPVGTSYFISQSNWIPVTLENPTPLYTKTFTETQSRTIRIDKVFDSSISMTVAGGTEWDEDAGIVVVGQQMVIKVDKMPTPSAGTNMATCGYSTQLNGVKSSSLNTSLWWSESAASFTDNTIESPTLTVPLQGNYKLWFKEMAGTCKDSVTVTDTFNGYASATLSGSAEICGNDTILTTLETDGNYPLTYRYTDGTIVSAAITVNNTPFNKYIRAIGNQTFTISSITDKNNCLSPPSVIFGTATSFDLTPKPTVGTTQIVCANTIIATATIDAPNGQWTSSDGIFDDVNAPITKFTSKHWGESSITWAESRKGCPGYATQVHEFLKQPIANAGPTQTLFLETEANLAATPLDYGIGTWSTTASNIDILSPNLYNTLVQGLKIGETTFKWKVQNGICPADSATVLISVKDFTFSGGFTPNGDGINDVFEIFGLKQRPVPNNELKVFDPVGRLVYSQQDYNNSWDGSDLSGKKLPDGPYYFFFTGDGFTPVKGYVIIKSE